MENKFYQFRTQYYKANFGVIYAKALGSLLQTIKNFFHFGVNYAKIGFIILGTGKLCAVECSLSEMLKISLSGSQPWLR